ncbi:amino acid permease [Mycoplasma sp. NEAQ87857]|uniref:APC family permease n=1 Tax=Mycoplasma sp. NEAQ87857 TaxID=2683967 RepID=UPI0013178CB1|nr:APC family permease [Mycoplasma sp. NEAQ87857]QGZ97697.1 amino acid permease [Mycoplasma sp. NEAQ87857]
MSKHFTQRSFTFFTINFIVGLGFLTTISTVAGFGLWGYLIILIAGMAVFGVSLVFSRLSNAFKEHYGGSYAFAKHFNESYGQSKKTKFFAFFVGWNQFIQNPIISSVSPLFLANVITGLLDPNQPNYTLFLWITRVGALIFFIVLILLSTIGLKVNKRIIWSVSTIKWFVLLIGIFILLYEVTTHQQYDQNIMNHKKIDAQLLFANSLLFIYAFGGTEDVAAMVKDVKFKNFRKILFVSFFSVLGFYLIVFSLLLGLDIKLIQDKGLVYVYKTLGAVVGTVLFLFGFISNEISSKITISVATARKLAPLAKDGHIFAILAKKSKNGEFKNAIWFTSIATLVTMIVFWTIPLVIYSNPSEQNNFFDTVIISSGVALLIEDLLTLYVAFALEKKKVITKIPLWEKIYYIFVMGLIIFLLISFLFPIIWKPIYPNIQFDPKQWVVLGSYLVFILIGIIIYFANNKIKNKEQYIKNN